MAAEGCAIAAWRVAASEGVNGAATGWPRKDAPADKWDEREDQRQWGRDRMAAEGSAGPSA